MRLRLQRTESSHSCFDLCGYDLTVERKRKAFVPQNYWVSTCSKCVTERERRLFLQRLSRFNDPGWTNA